MPDAVPHRYHSSARILVPRTPFATGGLCLGNRPSRQTFANFAKTCRFFGISRQTFYQGRRCWAP